MGRGKKIGIILILAGLCIPVLAMLFADMGYDRYNSFWENAQNAGIVLLEKENPPRMMTIDELWNASGPTSSISDPVNIRSTKEIVYYLPCRYLFGLSIILVAVGIGLVILSKKVGL